MTSPSPMGSKGGRPSSYKPGFAEQAAKLCALGATDAELADFFKVSTVTIWRWQSAHLEFCNALKRGKEAADERVERSLYGRAMGYTYDAVKIFMPGGSAEPVYAPFQEHVPPDVTACIFWLKNRRADLWRDRSHTEVTGKDGAPLIPEVTDDQRAKALAVFLAKSGAAPSGEPDK